MASNTFTLDGTNAALETNFGVNSTGSVKVIHDGTNITAVPGAYSVSGIENGSTTVTVTLSDDYNTAGSTVVISRVDYVDPSSPASSLLYDVGKLPGGGVNPVQLRAELVHLLQLIGDVNGDTSGATVPLDNVELTDRINAIAAIVFNAPSEDGDNNWDGTGTPGDTVEDIEGRVDTLETGLAAEIVNRAADVDAEEAARIAADALLQSQIGTGVGLPAGSASDSDYDSLGAEGTENFVVGYDESGMVQVQDVSRLVRVAPVIAELQSAIDGNTTSIGQRVLGFDGGGIKYGTMPAYPSGDVATVTLTETGLYLVLGYISGEYGVASYPGVMGIASLTLGSLGSRVSNFQNPADLTTYGRDSIFVGEVINVTSLSPATITMTKGSPSPGYFHQSGGLLVAIRIGDPT